MKQIKYYSESTYVIRDLLSADQCDSLIATSERLGFIDAPITTTSGPQMRKDIRNNDRVILDSAEEANNLWLLCKPFLKPEWKNRFLVGLNERLRFYRYEADQQFDWHYDGYYQRENGERSQFTLMFYLNDDFEGGTTDFGDFSVSPQKGDALAFYHHQIHRGAPVTQGRKYVVRTDVMYSASPEKAL
ncbi:PKHD-type hydroxylase YbiX [Thalassocella blandensis]|nr:PKHD-type hydroxylase YbiX [Thalassocella blandensis]